MTAKLKLCPLCKSEPIMHKSDELEVIACCFIDCPINPSVTAWRGDSAQELWDRLINNFTQLGITSKVNSKANSKRINSKQDLQVTNQENTHER